MIGLFGEGFDQIELQNMCDAGNDRACSTLEEIEKICNAAAPGSIPVTEDCYKAITNFKLLPGEAKSDSGKQKEKFVGAVDCNKFFVRDLSLKPKALQDHSGIGNTKDECFLKSAQALPSVGGPPGGGVGGDCGPTSNFASLLPDPIPPSVGAESPGSFPVLDSGTVVQTAKKAASLTGVPCELLIGIHYVEAGWHDSQSFISGRLIGHPEPDVDLSECTSLGLAYSTNPSDPGCIFNSLEQTAIYAANEIRHKVYLLFGGGERSPANFEEMIGAMAAYNGLPGNANCGRPVPYSGPCPPPVGIDNPYSVSHFDSQHGQMFLIYCADYTPCGSLTPYTRDGTATAAKEFYLRNKAGP